MAMTNGADAALEKVVQQAIEECATTEGGPVGHSGEPSLAHYIAVKVLAGAPPASIEEEDGR
jgi:hypothetical protein